MKLAQRIQELAESATLAVSAKAARMKADGIDVVGFGAGEPDFDTPDNIKDAAIAAIKAGHTKYSKPASGIPAAKQAVCDKLARENDLRYEPGQVIVTASGKMCLYLAFQTLLDSGDEVVIPRPYWVSYPEMVKLAGGTPIFIEGPEDNDYKLTPDIMRAALTERTRIVVLTSPSNPSGVTYDPAELRAIAEVLQDRKLIVFSDEIYDRLVYGDQKFISYAAIGDKAFAQTLTLNGASKTFAMTGWRLGYASGPTELIKGMCKLQTQTTSGAATFSQHALIEALNGDQGSVESMRREFEKRAAYMHGRLTAMPGVRCPIPTGAFYCFPNVSGTYERLGVSGSIAFSERLLEQANVAVVPGIAFGLDAHVRLSFAASMEQIEKGLDRIEAMLSA